MNGIWVAASKPNIEESEVRRLLQTWFPRVGVTTQSEALDLESDWPPIVFSVEKRPVSDFPIYIGFDCFPGEVSTAVNVGIALAARFAADLGCRCACDGTGFGDDESPYWLVVWDQGRAFLADDSNTAFADGDGGEVRLLREIPMQPFELRLDGRLASVER